MHLSSTFDTSLGAELDEIRESIAGFAARYIAPRADDIDRSNTFAGDLWPQLGQLGALGPTVDEAFGGSALGYLAHVVIMEEISKASAAIGLSYGAHSNLCARNLHVNGTDEQRHRYLPALCDGTTIGALAMSEPDAGSDVLGSMRCTARLHGDTWLANGTKAWITNGSVADTFVAYMRTDHDTGDNTVTAFIVERGFDGFRSEPGLDKFGMRGSPTCELVFDNCPIPAANVLGQPGGGTQVLMSGLDSERLVLSGGPLGIMQAAFDMVLPYVAERKQFGKPIGTFQLMQAKLADMYVNLQSARAFTYRVAAALDTGRPSRADAAASLLHASNAAVDVTLEAMQALGGVGYVNESPAGRLVRDAKLYTIGAGTNEIRRMLIGRELLGHFTSDAST